MNNIDETVDPDCRSVEINVVKVTQPLGDMYVGSLDHKDVTVISRADVRRLEEKERDVEAYLGIQRPLDQKRAAELRQYVTFPDAAFPGSIILALKEEYTDVIEDDGSFKLRIRNWRLGETMPSIMLIRLASVLDGQHRLAGLAGYEEGLYGKFEVLVTFFVGMDISDQAYVFSTVNLEHKKVHRSLAYDLFSYARSRSPQKTLHNIALAFDGDTTSPFYQKIERLGVATPGRSKERITQSNFVEAILEQLLSDDPKGDRATLMRGKRLNKNTPAQSQKLVLRNWFIEDRDMDTARILHEYFSAVRDRWPLAWNSDQQGAVLGRSSGFRALVRLFRPMWHYFRPDLNSVTSSKFREAFDKCTISDNDFDVSNFPPGSSGEGLILSRLLSEMPFLEPQGKLL